MFSITERQETLTGAQCAQVIEQHRAKLQLSGVSGSSGRRIQSAVRVCSSCKLSPGDLGGIASVLEQAVLETTGASADRIEPWELIHYEVGGHYCAHVDWFDPKRYPTYFKGGGQRTHSALVYLSTVPQGGETVFPAIGRVVTPEVGLLIAWRNMSSSGQLCSAATHRANPVVVGEKWVLATWIREYKVAKAASK